MQGMGMKMTPEQVQTVLTRSASGDGVIAILKDLGLDPWYALIELKNKHADDIVAAKQAQLDNREKAAKLAQAAVVADVAQGV